MRRHREFRQFVVLAITLALVAGAAGAFSPARQFPDTSDGVYVFVDQLPGGLSTAQRQFAASHYVGTQKQTSGLIDAIRVYNPDFIMIQYRLGTVTSSASFIHNDTWSNDWSQINPHEDWFIHDNQGNRVYKQVALNEYVMDVSGNINGNPNGWKEYWAPTVISDINASHADGVFADCSNLPFAIPSSLWDSPTGSPPHTNLIPHWEVFYDYVYQQLDAADKYFIPNIAGMCTTLDTTNGYYEDVHGAMVEGYATKLSEFDWRLQQNRLLRLLRNDKIYIAQNGPSGPSDTEGRLWFVSNFLLMKHDRSYLNMLGAGSQMHWWPEYDLDLGLQVDPSVAGDVSELEDASGIYARQYERGLVLVNPTNSGRTYTLDGSGTYQLVEPWGGGLVNTSGQPAAGGLNYAAAGSSVTLDPWSGAVLTYEPPGPENEYISYSVKYLGDGKYGVTFTLHGNDGQQKSFFANMTFEGANGGEIQQVLAFGSGSVDSDDLAALYDPVPEANYDMDLDSYFLQPFPDNAMDISEAANSYHIEAGTGGASDYLDVGLGYIVTTGDLYCYGVVSRSMENHNILLTAEMPVPGDADLNDVVDGADYTAWADHYGQTDVGWEEADFNGDDVVDGADYTVWADFYGMTGTSPAPEPATAALMALGLVALLRRRRR